MNKNLPFTQPEQDLYFNVSLGLSVLRKLSSTKKGKLLINNERLALMIFLLKNPLVAAKLLTNLGHSTLQLSASESYSVRSLAPNLDELLDQRLLKAILIFLAQRKMLAVSFRKLEGAMYTLTETGYQAAEALVGPFFSTVLVRLERLADLNSVPTKVLYQQIYSIITKP
ncbi:ABC-three component system middle component 4 [Massilia horti]|uniref:Uncharacterized protein n=1 Tax=Massilia horti TaxID=2562153 RepID=A0A4Y9SSW6_9BURK|nr:ABC-three component system middle component 4 [Massilia horti]TFW06300.1 hypothetical protein E4K72_10280 [Oxalobacteraceae bacterium OM1]TFW29882.1 hypothetical protein E4O92_17860 [Massilia horti]